MFTWGLSEIEIGVYKVLIRFKIGFRTCLEKF